MKTLQSLACYLHAFLFSYMTRAGLILCDVDPKAIETELKRISAEHKTDFEKAWAEAKKAGDISAESKEKIDQVFTKQGELQAQVLDLQQKAARQATDEQIQASKSIGYQLIESEEFKAWKENGGMRTMQSSYVFPVNAAIISTPTTNTTTVGVPPDVRPGILEIPYQGLTVRDLITPGRTTSNLIYYLKETGFTNNAAPVSEGDLKPESTITYDDVQTPVRTIAHWIKASKQILDDFAQLQSSIDGRLRQGLKIKEEAQLLKGSGVGNNLNGIYTQATAYATPSGGVLPGSPTKIDIIRLMLLQAELAFFPSTGIVMHPTDWAMIELRKDTLGRYIIGDPQGVAQPRLWGRPVVATQAMTVDTALVGAFMLGAQIFDREDVNVVIATENDTDFVKNLITIRCEERLALAVYRPEAFIKNADLPAS